jgi:hypothetical protein
VHSVVNFVQDTSIAAPVLDSKFFDEQDAIRREEPRRRELRKRQLRSQKKPK